MTADQTTSQATVEATVEHTHRRNIVLTGPPRSGTTLACWLLNKVPNTLALVEPIRPFGFVDPSADAETIRGAMARFFHRQRRTVQELGVAQSKNVGGLIPSDPYASRSSDDGLRYQRAQEGAELGDVEVVDRLLRPGFWLVVKDPATLSALLPVLVGRFPCYAIVRNPLSILASWDSVNHAARDGHSPVAERYDDSLREELAGTPDRRARQLRLLDWWFSRFRDFLPDGYVIRYEDIIASNGRALSAINPAAELLDATLESKNLNPLYRRDEGWGFGEALLESEGAYWSFYRRQEVENLLAGKPPRTGYQRGYADAALKRAPRALIGGRQDTSSVREELEYHAGYAGALDDLTVGHYDPAEVVRDRGWVSPREVIPPLAERRGSP
jgi:hypothetical protein